MHQRDEKVSCVHLPSHSGLASPPDEGVYRSAASYFYARYHLIGRIECRFSLLLYYSLKRDTLRSCVPTSSPDKQATLSSSCLEERTIEEEFIFALHRENHSLHQRMVSFIEVLFLRLERIRKKSLQIFIEYHRLRQSTQEMTLLNSNASAAVQCLSISAAQRRHVCQDLSLHKAVVDRELKAKSDATLGEKHEMIQHIDKMEKQIQFLECRLAHIRQKDERMKTSFGLE
ncbi:hypothetical protein XU18_2899 [Perkinsela sp. CCAP 1560/4]|nr:hypothetical protein XU18_2899 [Perkinsela sp. CCAP 1560/4]|eukprot:KNH06394.1 hypothetical protein XU18_2899 [Perkinsela sp. CCAP 1560/4]